MGNPVHKQSQDVYKCIYHKNINLICLALTNKASTKIQLHFKEVSTADDIWQLTVCDIYIEDCVWRRCSKCKASNISKLFPFQDVNLEIEYYQ